MSELAMFTPPRVIGAALDRALFSKRIPLAAGRVLSLKNISKIRSSLEKNKDLLRIERIGSVRRDPDPTLAERGGKCLLLSPTVKIDDRSTWSSYLEAAVRENELVVIPYELHLEYDYWTYLDVMKAILPLDQQDEIPVGFAIVGHIAHLNLREQYLPYKKIIAEVIRDKNPTIRTVINKLDNVGDESEYRTFAYEVLAGPNDMNVEVREAECTFKFDYSKVYWNTRLSTEHGRLVELFQAGEVVCDVMAGIGPFAIPAGKKGVFVWANDLNPNSHSSLVDAIKRNKVGQFVRPSCCDGHDFIRQAADEVRGLEKAGNNKVEISARRSRTIDPSTPLQEPQIITIPQTISHFVMNLPASAMDFLPSYRGLYASHEALFAPETGNKLPMIHVHCFSTKSDDNIREGMEITELISHKLGIAMRFAGNCGPDGTALGDIKDREVKIHDVRDVAPLKRMFCASFRLPAEVAFGYCP